MKHLKKFESLVSKINESEEEEDYIMRDSPSKNGELNKFLKSIIKHYDDDEYDFAEYFTNWSPEEGTYMADRFIETLRRFAIDKGWKITKI